MGTAPEAVQRAARDTSLDNSSFQFATVAENRMLLPIQIVGLEILSAMSRTVYQRHSFINSITFIRMLPIELAAPAIDLLSGLWRTAALAERFRVKV